MIRPDQDPIVSVARGWSWPGLFRGSSRDLDLGPEGQPSSAAVEGARARTGDGRLLTGDDEVKAATAGPPPLVRQQGPAQTISDSAGQPVGTLKTEAVQAAAQGGRRAWLIGAVILALALFHAAPHLADWFGDPRLVLAKRLAVLPFGQALTVAASGWLWEPAWVWLGATALRLRALQRLGRDPAGGVTLALIALLFQTGVWLVIGPKAGDPGTIGAEQSALLVMLFVEGAIVLCLYGLTGRGSSARS